MHPEPLPPKHQNAPPLEPTTSKTARPTWKTLLEILDQLCAPVERVRPRFAPNQPNGVDQPENDQFHDAEKDDIVKHGLPTLNGKNGFANAKGVHRGLRIVKAASPAPFLESAFVEKPREFVLHPNQPNPFNPQTTIRFGLPEKSAVRLMILNRLGRHVRVLVDGQLAAGMHEVVFEAGDLPKGMYLCRLQTPEGSLVKKMVLVK